MTPPKRVEHKSILDLHFDPENPRLPPSFRGKGDRRVFEYMLEEETLPELMEAIGEQGYFEGEPVLVVPRKAGGLTVVEGNRRLAAVKLLQRPGDAPVRQRTVKEIADAAKHKPNRLPVLEFPNRDDILADLGYRHVTGIKEWDPLQKARYLKQLSTHIGGPLNFRKCQQLARQIGSKGDYVARLLVALQLYDLLNDEDFFSGNGIREAEVTFSLFTTALSYEKIASFLGLESGADFSTKTLDNGNLRDLFLWLFQQNREGFTRLGESRNLSLLASIVAEPRALKAFRRGKSLDEAVLLDVSTSPRPRSLASSKSLR